MSCSLTPHQARISYIFCVKCPAPSISKIDKSKKVSYHFFCICGWSSWDTNRIYMYAMNLMRTITRCDRDKSNATSRTTFSDACPVMKMYEYCLRFHWSLFLGFELTIFQHWFSLVGAKPLFGPMVVSSLTYICVTRPQWVKKLSDVN